MIIVISPLLSLMNDQVMRWTAAKVKCDAIAGDMHKTIADRAPTVRFVCMD